MPPANPAGRVAVTGHDVFLKRYAPLCRALAAHVDVVTVPTGNLLELPRVRVWNRLTRGTPLHGRMNPRDRSARAFAARSAMTGRKLDALHPRPDAVLNLFGGFASPASWRYAMYLDFTMQQAIDQYPPWAEFRSDDDRITFLELEATAYARAQHLFTFSDAVKASLVTDYGIDGAQVTAVGSGGQFDEPYAGEKTFGSYGLIIDASDPHRKGLDIALEALDRIRMQIPQATLTVVGTDVPARSGIRSMGMVRDTATMRQLLLAADLAIAPARCDPFPGFVIEAMNYGVPCLVSDVNGLAGDVSRSGAGMVIHPDSTMTYGEAALALLRNVDELTAMSTRARQVVTQRLNWPSVAARMATILHAIATS